MPRMPAATYAFQVKFWGDGTSDVVATQYRDRDFSYAPAHLGGFIGGDPSEEEALLQLISACQQRLVAAYGHDV